MLHLLSTKLMFAISGYFRYPAASRQISKSTTFPLECRCRSERVPSSPVSTSFANFSTYKFAGVISPSSPIPKGCNFVPGKTRVFGASQGAYAERYAFIKNCFRRRIPARKYPILMRDQAYIPAVHTEYRQTGAIW